MKNRIKKLILLIIFNFTITSAIAYDCVYNGMYFDIISEKDCTAAITYSSYVYGDYAGDVVIPPQITYGDKVYTVTTIKNYTFAKCINLKSITIPSTVTKVSGSHVCENTTGLKRVILEDGDEPITIPKGYERVTSFEGESYPFFSSAELDSIYVGRNIITTGGSSPFAAQESLAKVGIGPNVKFLPERFIQGSNIDKINLPESIDSISEYAFSHCRNLKEVILPSNVKLSYKVFANCESLKSAYISNGTSIIPSYCFYYCKELTNVYIGKDVAIISDYAFSCCDSLTKLYLFSDILTTIGYQSIPSTLALIYVPEPKRYENLLKDYYTDNLFILYDSESEYSGSEPQFSFKNNVQGINISFDTSSIHRNAGKYNTKINVIFSYNDWCTSSEIPCLYTITPAPLTIIANDASRKYGEENPELTCSYYGFKNNENEDVLTQKAQLVTNAVASSNVGTYSIIPINAEAQNYSMVYERGTLTITQADQTITWDDDVYYAEVGEQIELTAISTSGLEIKYEVSDESLAEIYRSGGKQFIDCLKSGEVTIKAYQDGNENFKPADRLTKKLIIKDKVVQAENISLSKSSISLRKGESYKLIATIYPENATSKEVVWKSSNENIVAISNTGVVTALEEGVTTIVATTVDGSNLSAICDVVVQPTLAESLILDKSELTLNVSEKIMLVATISPTSIPNKELRWTSSNDAIATVDKDGIVTAIATGEAIITVATTDGSNLSATCKVIVVPVLAMSIELDQTEVSVEEKSDLQLTATILPEHTTNKEVAWSSSDKWVASVDNYGLVTMYSAGEVIITATTTDGTNLSATCSINVYSGIDGVNGHNVIVVTIGDNIVLKNAKLGSVVNVYASYGALIASEEAKDGSVVVEAPVKGVYVVKVGKQTVKVII